MATFFGNVGAMAGVPGIPSTMPTVRGYVSGESPVFEYPSAISGVTRDSTGAALASCAVIAYRTADNSIAAMTTSDASGNYRVDASQAITHYVVAYKAGSPDVAGTSLNTIVGT